MAGSAFLRERIARGEMGLVGAYHDIATRTVQFGELVKPDDMDLAA
jgi:carbonic anhydrase